MTAVEADALKMLSKNDVRGGSSHADKDVRGITQDGGGSTKKVGDGVEGVKVDGV